MTMETEDRNAVVKFRMEKADATYGDVLKSMEMEMFGTAANRLYYAFYYAATALLISKGILTHKHSSLQSMMHLHFVKTGILSTDEGLLMRELFDLRQKNSY